jgi:broad specificity phosphatase PhoE
MNHHALYLLRHGETLWNTELRLQGSCDSPLTERGRRQAEAMGRALSRALADDGLDAQALDLVSSPLGRTRETAAIVGRVLGVPAARWCTDSRLVELRYGEWEGCVWHDIVKLAPEDVTRWRADPHAFTPPAGESHAELSARTRSFLDAALASVRPQIIVGHGVAGATLRGLYLGLTPAEIFVLEKPQDAFFRLHGGAITKIAASIDALV